MKRYVRISVVGLLLLFVKCTSPATENAATELPEKEIIVKQGIWSCAIESKGQALNTMAGLALQELSGTILISDTLYALAPILDRYTIARVFNYFPHQEKNHLELKYQSDSPKDSLTEHFYDFNESMFTRDLSFELKEQNGIIEFQGSDLEIKLVEYLMEIPKDSSSAVDQP